MATLEKYAHLKVSCPNEDLGCPWKGLLKDVDEHSVPCEKKIFRSAIIDIQMLKGRLEQKDREIHFLKNDFALKVQTIANQRVAKKKEKLVNIRNQTEKLGEILFAKVEEVQKENVKKNEEIVNLKKDMEELKQARSEDNKKLRSELEEVKKENQKLSKEINEVRNELKIVKESSNIKEKKSEPSNSPTIVPPPQLSTQVQQNPNLLPKTGKVFFDMAVNGNNIGRLEIDLFLDKAPNTCDKFAQLCRHEKGVGYKGSKVFYISNELFSMSHTDTLTYPTDGKKQFPDEYVTCKENMLDTHNEKGIVSMGLDDKTRSAFFITLKPLTKHDGKYVIIGKMREDSWPTVKEILKQRSSPRSVSVSNCGVLV